MDDIDDSKSLSSQDAKMEKESGPKLSGEGGELEAIEEQNEDEKQDEDDVAMEEENEDFLSKILAILLYR